MIPIKDKIKIKDFVDEAFKRNIPEDIDIKNPEKLGSRIGALAIEIAEFSYALALKSFKEQ